jgi:4-methoxybenzoate monooxygenase (O-demethylating)
MTITEHSPIPVSYADPFGPEVLEDPHPFHRDLREAGPVVRLDKYDLYAMGRYEQVHAALVNWQEFISSDGVGLLSFRNEKPWRPPSVLLEADPPAHDAPRRVLAEILGPRTLRNLRGQWFEDARKLVDEVLPPGQVLDVDVMTALAEAFPLRVFPDAVGLG